MIYKSIKLSCYELELLRIVAKNIEARNPDLAINIMHKSGKVGGPLFIGKCAEYAYCKMFNLMPDLIMDPREGGSIDVTDRQGNKIDVKWTEWIDGGLIIPHWKKKYYKYVDRFVLMKGKVPNLYYYGWIEAEIALNDNRIVDLGHGPTYLTGEHELKNN